MFGGTVSLSTLRFSDGVIDGGGTALDGCSTAQRDWLKRYTTGGLRKLRRQEEQRRALGSGPFKPTPAEAKRALSQKTRETVKTIKKIEDSKQSLKSATRVWVKSSVGELELPARRHRFVVVPSFFRADLICVESLEVIHAVKAAKNSKGATGDLMEHCVLVARLLGLRLATPAFFKQSLKQQRTDASSVKFDPLVRHSTLYVHITPAFEKRQSGTATFVRHAACKPGSKWKIVDDVASFDAFTKTNKPCLCIRHLHDLHSWILAAPLHLDKARSSTGVFVKSSPQAVAQCG